jgi:hypothetical protein
MSDNSNVRHGRSFCPNEITANKWSTENQPYAIDLRNQKPLTGKKAENVGKAHIITVK